MLLLLLACPEPTDSAQPEPPSTCLDQTVPWDGETLAFRDATEEWGLVDLGAVGFQVEVVDLDNDGLPDLVLHQEGGIDDYTVEDGRVTWVLRNTGEGFEDITEASGFRQRRGGDPSMGRPGQAMAFADFDNDGDMDVFTAAWVDDPSVAEDLSEVLLNNGDGTFTFGPEEGDQRREGMQSKPASVAATDFDRDGNVDLWVVENGYFDPWPLQDRLYRGLGDGTFEDVTEERGLQTIDWVDLYAMNNALAHTWGWAANACDLNNDGLPELMAAAYGRTPNHLWQAYEQDGTTHYENRSVASGYAFDDNQDWSDDINAQCHCYDNPEDEDCHLALPPPSPEYCAALFEWYGGGYRWDHYWSRQTFFLGGVSGTTVCADVNNDGAMDLVTGEIVHPDVGGSADRGELLLNTGMYDVFLARPGNDLTGLDRGYIPAGVDEGVMNAVVMDFDNDGWQDIYYSVSGYPNNHGWLFRQVRPGVFERLDHGVSLGMFGSHGAQAVDLDQDGDLDLVVGHMPVYCGSNWGSPDCYDPPVTRIWINEVGNQQNWLQLELEGTGGSNAAAIGARVEVTANGVTQTQEVDGGHGRWSTQKDRVLHFGVGEACDVEVRVRWPDAEGTVQTYSLEAGARYTLVQGD